LKQDHGKNKIGKEEAFDVSPEISPQLNTEKPSGKSYDSDTKTDIPPYSGFWNKFIKETKCTDLVMAFATIVIAGAIMTYTHYAREQWNVMKDQAHAFKVQLRFMQQQLTTMKEQTDNMERQSKLMNAGLDETRKIVQQNNLAVKAAEIQASASKESANTSAQAIQIARLAMINSTRPYVDASANINLIADQPLIVDLVFFNEGNSPATVTGEAKIVVSEANTLVTDFNGTKHFQDLVILPHKEKHLRLPASETLTTDLQFLLTTSQIEKIKQRKLYLYIYGSATYFGIGGPYSLDFTDCYMPEVSAFADCIPNKK